MIESVLDRLKYRPYFCDIAVVQVVLNREDIRPSSWNNRYVLERPGSDGIEFWIDIAQEPAGVIAYYPNTNDDGVVAKDFEESITRWIGDEIPYPF